MDSIPCDAEELALVVLALQSQLERAAPWRRDALCAEPGYGLVMFFPAKGAPARVAKALCARCLVRAECLAFALTDIQANRHGVWGATAPRERRDEREPRVRVRCRKGHALTRVVHGGVERSICRTCASERQRVLATRRA